MVGVTAKDAPDGAKPPLEQAMAFYRYDSVIGAAGIETATRRKQGGNAKLVDSYKTDADNT